MRKKAFEEEDEDDEKCRRLTISITPEVHDVMRRCIPRGLRQHLLEVVLEMVLQLVETGIDPYLVTGALKSGKYSLELRKEVCDESR